MIHGLRFDKVRRKGQNAAARKVDVGGGTQRLKGRSSRSRDDI